MSFKLDSNGIEGQNIEVETSFWSALKLLQNGEPVKRGGKRNELMLRRNDGEDVYVLWKPQFLGMDAPQLIVDGKLVNVAPPLKWYEWLWGGLPLLLIALGVLAGVIAFSANLKIFGTELGGMM